MEREIEDRHEIASIINECLRDGYVNASMLARRITKAGYRLCGGDNCPNFKHYQAECARCTRTTKVKKSLEIESAVKQAVKEVADRLKERFTNRITALKNSEEECQEVGDWETAARCKVAYNEIENVLNGLNQIITELYGADE